MDFAFNERQELMRRTLHELLERVCPPEYAMDCDKKGEAPVDAYKALADDGWIGVSTPEEYGGMGGDALDLALVLETAGMHYMDLATMIFRNVCYGVDALLVSGTDAQKKDFISATIQGEKYFAFSLTEPDAGSDAAAIIARGDFGTHGLTRPAVDAVECLPAMLVPSCRGVEQRVRVASQYREVYSRGTR